MSKRLTRSKTNRMLFGVAAGIADYLNVDATLVRMAIVLLTLLGGPGIIIYIVMLIVMPDEDYVGTVHSFDPEEVVIKDN